MEAPCARAYNSIGDLAELEIVLRELRRTARLLSRFADRAFEDYDMQAEWAVGMRMASSLIRDTLISAAEVRWLTLMASSGLSDAESKGVTP